MSDKFCPAGKIECELISVGDYSGDKMCSAGTAIYVDGLDCCQFPSRQVPVKGEATEQCFVDPTIIKAEVYGFNLGIDAAIAAARKIQTEQYPEIYSYNEKTCPLCAIDKVIAALEALKKEE